MSDPRWDADLRAGGARRVAARAVAWSAASQGGRQLLQFAVVPLLATLLSSADYGLMGMTSVLMGFVMALNDIGARSALQREASLNESLVVGCFWLNAGLGAACTAATALSAWPVALFYGQPRLVGVILALSPCFLLGALGFTSLSLLQRRLAQRSLSAIELTAAVASAVAALVAAHAGAGPYSLVMQVLVGTGLLTTLALILAPIPVLAPWAWADVRPIVGYSANLAAFSAVNTLARNGDYILLGRLAGAEITGLYYFAYRLTVEPVSQVAAVIGRVALPILAQAQGAADRLRAGQLQLAGAIARLTFPATLGLVAVRHELIAVVGERWAPVAPLILLLAPVGIVQAVFAPLGSLYQVRGRTDLMLRVGTISAIALFLALLVGVQWDAEGVAAAYSIAMVAMAVPIIVIPLRLIDLRLVDLLRELSRPFLAAVLMAIVVSLARPLAPKEPALVGLLALVGLGVVTQAALSLLLDRARMHEALDLLMKRR